jgi:dihydrofolate reductase
VEQAVGSITLVRQLMAAGLVDRLRLVVFPHVLGQAGREPVFADYPETGLTLVGTAVLDSRLMICEYRPGSPA